MIMGKKNVKVKNGAESKLRSIEKRLSVIAGNLQKAHFYDYIQYVSDEKRMMKRSFLLGLLKGVGAAIGFSLLGAVIVYILHLIAESNLPYIADFISDIINIINNNGK